MNKILLFLVALTMTDLQAQSCFPSDCSPACGSSCHYKSCTQKKMLTQELRTLPITFLRPTDSCQPIAQGTLNTLPTTIGNHPINRLPHTLKLEYLTCESRSKHGPPCPIVEKKE